MNGGVFILGFVSFFLDLFSLLASWLFGFLAFRVLGFLAFRLLGFLAFCYAAFGGFLALFAFPVQNRLRLQLFAGLCSFGWLWLSASYAFPVPLRFIGFGLWRPASSTSPVPPCLNHHFFGGAAAPANPPATFWIVCKDLIAPLFESSLLQTSWAGAAAPPPPPSPLLLRFLAEIQLHPYLVHHFFEHPISRENAVKYDILCNLCNLCMFVCMYACTASKS